MFAKDNTTQIEGMARQWENSSVKQISFAKVFFIMEMKNNHFFNFRKTTENIY